MCTSCVSNAEALIVGAVGAASATVGLTRRAIDALSGHGSDQRRLEAYQANADFLSALGHDPAQVLGAAPRPGPARVPAARAGALLAT